MEKILLIALSIVVPVLCYVLDFNTKEFRKALTKHQKETQDSLNKIVDTFNIASERTNGMLETMKEFADEMGYCIHMNTNVDPESLKDGKLRYKKTLVFHKKVEKKEKAPARKSRRINPKPQA